MFVDWLASQKGGAKIQSTYEEVESEAVCLQETTYRNCRALDLAADNATVTRGYTEAKVACCKSLDGEKYSSALGDLFAEAHSVGECNYVETYFDKPVLLEGGVKRLGTFKATCELSADSDKCGSPLCEGMSLHACGDIMRYDHVAFMHGLSEATTLDGYCPNKFPIYAEDSKIAKLQSSKDSYDDDDDEPIFHCGQGDIYAGELSVVSRHHKTAYKHGKFQRIISTGPTDAYVKAKSTPPEKSFVCKDGAIALDFYKSSGYY